MVSTATMLPAVGRRRHAGFFASRHLTAAVAAVFSEAMPAVYATFGNASAALVGRGCMARITTITTTVTTCRVRSVVFA